MIYHVIIEAQVEWEDDVEADSREEAKEEARERFQTSQWTNSTSVELINNVTVTEMSEPDAADIDAAKMKKKETGETRYSKQIPGDKRNHDRPASFDYCDGCIGITQEVGHFFPVERVLLTPHQFDELVEFVKRSAAADIDAAHDAKG